jgi:cytochrome c553
MPMRTRAIPFLLVATACQQQTKPSPKPVEITFDGAQATDAAAVRAHGERLTHVVGCTSCHGPHLEGEQFEPEMTQYGPIYASNLTVEVPEYTDVQLDGIIRHGMHPERQTVWVMPSEIFQHLGDSDYRALAAYLRSLRPVGRKLPLPQFSKVDKEEIASGKYKPATELVREDANEFPVDLGPQHALGRYISEVTCAECHGLKLEGEKPSRPGVPPDLVVAGAYSRDEFERLLTKGIPTGNRKIREMMSGVAKYRFSYLTRHERDALYAYLKARAEHPTP